ncbi:MAG: hypothetical protein J7621_02070 [Niastella sp.]|nr:hypothetical protein [Niastella sp.]
MPSGIVRGKSSLTREKVLTHPAFHKTCVAAGRLVTATKIASSIYSDLPQLKPPNQLAA